MEENQSIEQSNKRSEYELKRQRKMDEQKRIQRKKTIRKVTKITLIVLVTAGVVGAIGWSILKIPPTPESDIVSRYGIHWHPQLSIYINGVLQEIPANLGLGVVERPVHTHDTTGTLHLEIQGLVRKDDVKLNAFFKVWGKQFNSNCILDSCNGPNGKVKMLVNGKENTEFENYHMQDKDKIEIHYE